MKYLKSGKKILALLLVITIVLTNVPLTLLSVEAEETTKLTVEWSEDSFNYDGTAKIPTATITDNVIEGGIDNGKLVVNSLETRQILIYDYLYVTMSITSGENVNAGDFTVTLTLSGNDGSKYSLDVASKEYTISQKSLASEATVDIDIEEDSYYYTGSEVKPEVTSVTVDGERWIETTDYEVSYSNNIATGTNTASVVIIPETDGTNSKNYTDTARESFSIVYLTVDGDVTVTSTTGSGGAVNNYYTSATFTAPDDFYIRQVTSAGASIEGQNWGTSFTVISSIGIDNGEVYYQLKNSDDALTDTTKYSTATY